MSPDELLQQISTYLGENVGFEFTLSHLLIIWISSLETSVLEQNAFNFDSYEWEP